MNIWVHKQNRSYVLWIVILLFFLGLYAIVNHLPFSRHVIPFVLGEQHVPFLPWTFVIYLSVFLQYFVIIRRVPFEMLKVLLLRFLWVIGIALVVFIIFPTEYPRYLYQNTNWLINIVRATDGPGNCFPSLHVAETIFLAAAYGFVEKRKLLRVLMWVWSVFIIVSVLTTKQHYLIDILGGAVLVVPFLFLAKRDLLRQKILN